MAFRMGLIGKKLGMTQVYSSDGERIPVTAILAGPCVVIGKRTQSQNRYSALQLGFGEQKPTRINRPLTGYFAKQGVHPTKMLLEIRLPDAEIEKYQVGQVLKPEEVFQSGTAVDVFGTSKGKGFQGVMKRHHMSGSPNSHGSHEFFRHGGSIGCRLTPGRVHKGKRMSGHMGHERVAVQNLEVVEVLPEQSVVLVRGAVPGPRNGYVLLKNAVKKTIYKRKLREVAEEKSKNPMKAAKASAASKSPQK